MIYFIVLIVLGLTASLMVIFDNDAFVANLTIINKAMVGAMSTSLMGSSIFYGRKLYKASINLDMVSPANANQGDDFRQLGIIYYFILRPLFALCFSVLTVLVIKSGVHFVSDSDVVKENFIFALMVISFFIGYSSGDFIDGLEETGRKVVTGVTGKMGNNQQS